AWYNSVGTALITMVLIDVWQWTPLYISYFVIRAGIFTNGCL
ncbi:unnamed protein product, partial [marine sediment metagenome]